MVSYLDKLFQTLSAAELVVAQMDGVRKWFTRDMYWNSTVDIVTLLAVLQGFVHDALVSSAAEVV
jgi:hypothetical protein